MHRGVAVVFAVSLASVAAAANPSQEIDRARSQYSRGQYQQTVETIKPLLYPRVQLADAKELIEAHYLLGVSYFFLKKKPEAKAEFRSILFIDPDYKLDPETEDTEVYTEFNATKRELKKELDDIRKKREEEEQKTRQPQVQTEITVRERSPLYNWVPFGAPQFQAGRPGWGTFFLVSQGVLGGTSFGFFAYQVLRYGLFDPRYPREDFGTIQTMQTIQIGTGAAFLLVYAWGVVDAFARPVTRRSVRQVPVGTNVSVVPLLAPEAAGLGARWEF